LAAAEVITGGARAGKGDDSCPVRPAVNPADRRVVGIRIAGKREPSCNGRSPCPKPDGSTSASASTSTSRTASWSGKGEGTAEEIAARTVSKDRARAGESETASKTSLDDISSERRGGLRSHQGEGGRTFAQLYAEAAKARVKGRSKMSKAELERAVGR
jgi:hypothetical protein